MKKQPEKKLPFRVFATLLLIGVAAVPVIPAADPAASPSSAGLTVSVDEVTGRLLDRAVARVEAPQRFSGTRSGCLRHRFHPCLRRSRGRAL